MQQINALEEKRIKGSEAITIGLVCAVLAISIFIVVGWKLYQSSNGSVTIPGGFKFNWSAFKSNIVNLINK